MTIQFITATGTDIGKTWLACALLRHWRAAGLMPHAAKPVLSGYDAATAATCDAGQLLSALGRNVTTAAVAELAPWRFVAPLSPDLAAAREGSRIEFDQLVAHTRRLASADFAPGLVEGVGGVMAPLDERHTVRDWIAASGLPAVLVTGSYLGSLSHALTALAALRGAGVTLTAIVVNESPEASVTLSDTLLSLANHCGPIPLIGIERGNTADGVAALANRLWPGKING